MIRLLCDLINHDTQNPPGNERILAQFIRSYLRDAPCSVEIQDVCDGRANVLARIPGRTHTKALLLNGHLDTVPHGGGWSSPAGAATQRDGKIYGRGASDMKSGLAALLYAFRDFARSGKTPGRDVLFAGTCDEESGGLGARALAESGALNGVSSIVIGEPTGLGMGLAAKGCLWLRLQVRGRTSHGAYPQRGINAIEGAFAFARALQADIAGGPGHPLLGQTTATLTCIQGGVKANVVPDSAEAMLDIRTAPGTDHAALLARGRALAQSLSEATPGLEIGLFVDNDRSPVETASSAPLAEAFSRCAQPILGHAPAQIGTAFFSDASVFARYGAFDVVLFGPGESDAAHTPNECVRIDACERAARVYRALL